MRNECSDFYSYSYNYCKLILWNAFFTRVISLNIRRVIIVFQIQHYCTKRDLDIQLELTCYLSQPNE